jgi:hypothetical protein
MTLELESKEKQTLTGILLVEQSDLKELIAKSKDEKDKQELELELVNVDWRAKF